MKERGHLSFHYLMMEGPNFLLTLMKSASLSLSIKMRQKLFRTLKLMNLLKVLMNHHNLKNRMFYNQQENSHVEERMLTNGDISSVQLLNFNFNESSTQLIK